MPIVRVEELCLSPRRSKLREGLWREWCFLRMAARHFAVRLLLMAGVHPLLLACGQLLHAFSFGLFHVAAVTATHLLFPDSLRSSGQSLYSSLTYGLGNLLGFFGCAALLESVGIVGLFGLSSALAWVALVVSLPLRARRSGHPA